MNDQDPMEMNSKRVRQNCPIDDACQKIMHQAVRDLGLTSADHDNILRYAKRAANMTGNESITTECLIDAIKHHQAG
jgi:predicted ATPase with chaperone activity